MRRTLPVCLLLALTLPAVATAEADLDVVVPSLESDVSDGCVFVTPIVYGLIGDPVIHIEGTPDVDQCLFPMDLQPSDALAGPGVAAPITGAEALVCQRASDDGAYACGQPGGRTLYVYLMAAFFQHKNYGGDNFGIFSMREGGSPCANNSNPAYAALSMPAGWNDKVSSIVVWSGCLVHFWQHDSFRGADEWCRGSCPDLGWYDNRISSFKIW